MVSGGDSILKWLLLLLLLIPHRVDSLPSVCEFSFISRNRLFNFNLASPLANFPHGVLSEDGFYKTEGNETVLWFQLCDGMIFNHDPPKCVGCQDCGGSSHCGMACSALVADKVGGYDVCTTLGQKSTTDINIIDQQNPHKGVIVRMSSGGATQNCSLSISVLCDAKSVQGPFLLQKSGSCDYATALRHPAGCATIRSVSGSGWSWFLTLITIILCLFGAYLLAGAAYRFFALGVRGIHVIPNLDFWIALPYRIQSTFASLLAKFRGVSHHHRTSYSPVDF